MQLALPNIEQALTRRFPAPPAVPPVNTPGSRFFSGVLRPGFSLSFSRTAVGLVFLLHSPP